MSKTPVDAYALMSLNKDGPTPLQVITEWPEMYSPPEAIYVIRGQAGRAYHWTPRREILIAAAWRRTRDGRSYTVERLGDWSYTYRDPGAEDD